MYALMVPVFNRPDRPFIPGTSAGSNRDFARLCTFLLGQMQLEHAGFELGFDLFPVDARRHREGATKIGWPVFRRNERAGPRRTASAFEHERVGVDLDRETVF